MNLRPVSLELLTTCAANQWCCECSMRLGCSFRFSFYRNDEFGRELALQLAELHTLEVCGDEDYVFQIAEKQRKKILREITEHPHFEFR